MCDYFKVISEIPVLLLHLLSTFNRLPPKSKFDTGEYLMHIFSVYFLYHCSFAVEKYYFQNM